MKNIKNMDLHVQKMRKRIKKTFKGNVSWRSILFFLFFLLLSGLCIATMKLLSKIESPSQVDQSIKKIGSPEGSIRGYSKVPTLSWYNKISSTTENDQYGHMFWNKERRLACYNGTQLFKCRIYPYQSHINADGFLFYGGFSLQTLPVLKRNGRIWGLFQAESPLRLAAMNEAVLNLFNFSATFSRHSNVPVPLLWFRGSDTLTSREYYINTTMKNSYLEEISPVIYLQSNCGTFTERDEYVLKLMDYINVDSYGYCLHNKELPLDPSLKNNNNQPYHEDLLKFMAKYKFIIAIENAVCYDYVTEKLWRSLEIGVVPIYYGSPLIRDWLPNNKSAILFEDFPTPELLSRHLHYLLSNDTAYEEYLEHKTKGVISNSRVVEEITARPYQKSLGEAVKKFECFVCEKLHNRDSSVNIVTKDHYNCSLPMKEIDAETSTVGYRHV